MQPGPMRGWNRTSPRPTRAKSSTKRTFKPKMIQLPFPLGMGERNLFDFSSRAWKITQSSCWTGRAKLPHGMRVLSVRRATRLPILSAVTFRFFIPKKTDEWESLRSYWKSRPKTVEFRTKAGVFVRTERFFGRVHCGEVSSTNAHTLCNQLHSKPKYFATTSRSNNSHLVHEKLRLTNLRLSSSVSMEQR